MTTLATRSPTSMTSSSTAATRSDLTPFLRLDPRVITRRFADLSTALPGTAIRYAVKANPNPEVLRTLVRSGSGFDVASPAEVVACLAAGATPDQLLYSNPIKRRTDLKIAYDLGVRVYVVDCLPELLKVAEEAPGSSVLSHQQKAPAYLGREPPRREVPAPSTQGHP